MFSDNFVSKDSFLKLCYFLNKNVSNVPICGTSPKESVFAISIVYEVLYQESVLINSVHLSVNLKGPTITVPPFKDWLVKSKIPGGGKISIFQ